MRKCLVFIISYLIMVLCFGTSNTIAQEVPKSFERKIEKAEFLIYKKQYTKAEKLYAKALLEYNNNLSAIQNYIQLFPLSDQKSNRIKTLQKIADKGQARSTEIIALPFLQELIEDNKIAIMRQYIGKMKATLDVNHELQKNLSFYQTALLHAQHRVQPLDLTINDNYDLKFPHLSFQEQQLIYTRGNKQQTGTYYSSDWDSCYGNWLTPELLDYPFNDGFPQEGFYVSPDSRYILFSRCEQKVQGPEFGGKCDIFFTYYRDGMWKDPELLGPTINTYHDELHPFLSPDLKTLYFSSNRPGGYGGYDLYKSEFKDGKWTEAMNLGPEINTEGNELTPHMFADNQHLLFSSDGHPGFGGFDIFKSKKINENTWSTVQNMGAQINSYADELGVSVSLDASKIIVSSNRNQSEFEGFNLYSISGDLGLKPYQYISGIVYDSIYQDPLTYVDITVQNSNGGLQTNRGDGSYYLLQEFRASQPVYFSLPDYLEQKIVFDTLRSTYYNDYNIPLLSERDAEQIHDTVYIRMPRSVINEQFWMFFGQEWPEVFNYLNNRNIVNIVATKGVIYNEEEQVLSFNSKEKRSIEMVLCPYWISKKELYFSSPLYFEKEPKISEDDVYVDLEIISKMDLSK